MKNKLIIAFLKLFKKKAAQSNRILVVASTALGDTLWATPAIESLRKSFPEAYIAVLTSPIGEQVLRHNPWVNQIHILKEPMLFHFFSLRKKLGTFNDIIVLHASQRLMLPLCATLGATRIVGTAGINKGLDQLLTHPLSNINQHEIVRRLQLIETIGAKRHSETLSMFIQPNETAPPLPSGRWIALHPGSKDAFKRWPAHHFVQLGQALQAKGFNILITGTTEESELTKSIARQIPGATISDPHLPLRLFASLLQQVDLLIANDTGPVHLACALNKPVIAIYSPTNPKLCGPHKAKKAIVIAKPPTCQPCLKRKCREPFCFLQISPEEVLQSAVALTQ